MRLLLLLLLALPIPSGLGVGPAVADGSGRIGLSRDGVHWTAEGAAPLFDAATRWVPGDVRSARFFVRNQAEGGGDLTVAVGRSGRDGLAGTGWLRISARAGSGPWQTVDDAGRHRLVRLDDVSVGTVVPVQVRIALDRRAPNRTMVLASRLDLEVRLSESDAATDPDDGGLLPATGSTIPAWLPYAGLLLLATGVVLARRRDHDTPHPHPSETPS